MRVAFSLIMFFGFIVPLKHLSAASVIAKTTKDECIVHGGGGDDEELKTKSGLTCKQKLVVAMTVTANEGTAQKIEANIAKATDVTGTQAKNVQLEQPIRITISKSPVIINFRLFQVGQVANYPHEVMRRKRGKRCRDDWYAADRDFACPIARNEKGRRIFDSQGFCCPCDMKGKARYRGEDVKCYGAKRKDHFGHCLEFDTYRYFVFGFYPPQMQFKITINIEQLSYSKKDGSDVWESVSLLEVGPHKRIARSKDYGVKVTYIADFSPSEFLSVNRVAHRYLLVPNDINKKLQETKKWKRVYKGQSMMELLRFQLSRRNVSEWMAINKDKFDMHSGSCNKIGVGYSAFRYQSDGCTSKMGSCLLNQPFNIWKQEKEAQRKKRKGQYMLHNFGRVHSLPHTKKLTDYQVNFVADRPAKSFITVSMVADDMRVVVHKSPGRIVESYIEAFEALSTTGELVALVQNIGKYTATYNVYVLHCSAGIDMVPSDVVTLDPNKMTNISFTMHSFSALGKINNCGVELRDIDGMLLDNMTVFFETLDTCFCYGHCGCACGNETTVCPDPPTFDNSTKPENLNKWLTKFINSVKDFVGPLVSTFGTASIIILILLILGVLKVVHMVITGEIKMPAASEPTQMAMQFAKDLGEKIIKEWLPQAYDSCVSSCAKCTWSSYSAVFYILTCGRFAKEAQLSKSVERGWRRPQRCNGMCGGAKVARRNHRKQMRINKRRGMKNEMAWFQKPYTCTCKVKDTMPCCQIIKGLCFFYYCPLLPLYWALQFIYTYIKRKWKRHKRKKTFRETRAALEAQKQVTYLHLDKYSRGKVEREILDLDKDIKSERRKKIIDQSKGFTPDLEELAMKEKDDEMKSEQSSSDTTDVDEVDDIDELLNTGQPVYFNYAMPKDVPKSLVNPGKNFSIMGRLTADCEGLKNKYTFDLHIYTYQLKQVKKRNKCTPLKSPKPLESGAFERHIDSVTALKLITVTPLFVCLNGAQPT